MESTDVSTSAPAAQGNEPAGTAPAATENHALVTPLKLSALQRLERKPFNYRALTISIIFHIVLLGGAFWAYKRFSTGKMIGVVGRRGGHVTAPGPVQGDAIDTYNQSAAAPMPMDMFPAGGGGRKIHMLDVERITNGGMPIPAPTPWPDADVKDAAKFAPQPFYVPSLGPLQAFPPPPAVRSDVPIAPKTPATSQPSKASSVAEPVDALAIDGAAVAAARVGAVNGDPSGGTGGNPASNEKTLSKTISHSAGSSVGYSPPRPAGSNSIRGGRTARNGYDSRGLPVPDYPDIARQRNEQGRVELMVQVHADGTPGEITVVSDAGYPILAKAATDAVREATFIPASSGGSAVEGNIRITFQFVLN